MSNKVKRRPAAPTPRRWFADVPWVWILIALAVGALLGGPIAAATTDPRSDTERAIDSIKAADAERDAEQIVALTAQARQVRDTLAPVLDQFATAVPPGDAAPGPDATPERVTAWKAVTTQAVAGFADPPSAGTGVNIARSSLDAATRTLHEAVVAYEHSLRAPAPAKAAQLAHAGKLRDIAITTWAVGGTQLDQLNVDAGNGHAHVFLPSVPGQGAMTSDGSPEGR